MKNEEPSTIMENYLVIFSFFVCKIFAIRIEEDNFSNPLVKALKVKPTLYEVLSPVLLKISHFQWTPTHGQQTVYTISGQRECLIYPKKK